MIIVPEYIIVHHSLTKDGKTVSRDNIEDYHVNVLGMDDIGYHFIIEQVEKRHQIFTGRMMNCHGAHCSQKHMNFCSLGICFVGNFDKTVVPLEMWLLGIKLVVSLCQIFHIPAENVLGHRELAGYKTCPGKNFDMEAFRRAIRENLK